MRAAALALSILLGVSNCPGVHDPTPTVRCEEDQPCWNCHTMGNKTCSDREHVGKA